MTGVHPQVTSSTNLSRTGLAHFFANFSHSLTLGRLHQLEMASERYVYTQLSEPRQIRLLKLHPPSSPDDPELSVELVSTLLHDAPPFVALSYAWGDPLPRCEIRCSGRAVEIGPSLYGALRHLSDRNTGGKENWLWADALCINQDDNAEREAQVRIMSDIYAAATFTVIWLGSDDEHIRKAFYWLERFSDVFDTLNVPKSVDAAAEQALTARMSADDHLEARTVLWKAFGDSSSQTRAFRDIWTMLRHPWFTRKWVIQESVKSQTHGLLFLVGDVWMTWWKLGRWLMFLEWGYFSQLQFIGAYSWELENGEYEGNSHWVVLRRAHILISSSMKEARLFHLLAHTIMFKCTKPHDHIIALLGISSDSSAYKNLIDYDASAEDLYRRAICVCLSDSRELRIAWSFHATVPISRRLWGSWIPNIQELASGSIASSFSHEPERLSNASGGTQIQATATGNTLRIRGRVIDSIQRLGTDMSDVGEFAPVHAQARGSAEKRKWVLGRVDSWYDECQTIAESAGIDKPGLKDAVLIENFLEHLIPGSGAIASKGFFTCQQYLKTVLAAEDEAAYLEVLHNTTSEVREIIHVVESYLSRLFYRRFGCTRDRRIGWMPLVAEKGDRICVFDGMEYPYAIRPKEGAGGKYMLVGECYISGLMNGEAMKMSGVESEIITLE